MTRLITMIVLVASLAATPALADSTAVVDADDVADVMDMAEAAHMHTEERGVVAHSLSTYDPWASDEFFTAEWFFYVPGGPRGADRTLTVSQNPDGSFRAAVYDRSGTIRGFANVHRPDDRTIQVELPTRLVGRAIGRYRWKAFLHRPCSRDADVQCEPVPPDTHPDRVLHVLR